MISFVNGLERGAWYDVNIIADVREALDDRERELC